jgi:hypothetical protein
VKFKNPIQFEKDAYEKFAGTRKHLEAISDKWMKMKESGASQDELDKVYQEYNVADKAWRKEYKPKIKKEVRAMWVKQHHDFYVENAAKYNIEYIFIPKVEKSAFFDLEDDVAKADTDGDIALDADFNRMINEITEKIINDITGGGKLPMAKRYDTLVEVEKFNPYHDHLGRFTTAPGGGGGSSYGVGIAPKPLTLADFKKPRTYETFDQKKERLRGKTPSETIRNVEKENVKKEYEVLTVIDKEGGIIFFAEGSATHVSLTYREKAQLKNAYATHNHPSETHFSTADIRTTVETNGLGIRATTPSGKVYSLERKSMPDNRHEFSKEYDKQIQPVIDAAKSKMDSMGHSDRVKAGTMTQKEANVLFQSYINDGFSAWLTENASKYGFEYTEERVDVQKSARYDVITCVEKYNHNHDELGRFTFSPGGGRVEQSKLASSLLNFDKYDDYEYYGVRATSEDEEYETGDTPRNSYDWDYDNDVSSYETESPIEFDGSCAINTRIDTYNDDVDTIQSKLDECIERSKREYYGNTIVIIGSQSCTYGQDRDEIIMEDGEVLAVYDKQSGKWKVK